MYVIDKKGRISQTFNVIDSNRIFQNRNGEDDLKRIIAVLVSMFLLSFIVSPLNATETRLVWDFLSLWEEINVKIYTPYQAYPSDTMTIRIRVEANEDLQNVTVTFKIYGCMSKGYRIWHRPLEALNNIDLSSGAVEDQYFDVDIPEDVDPGLLHGHVSCSWKVWRESSWQEWSVDDCIHRVTYLRNKPYEDLQVAYNQSLADYNALLSSYNALQANFSALQADYNQLLADYYSLQTSYDDLEDRHKDLQGNYSVLEHSYSALLLNYGELQANYNSSQSSLNSLQEDYDNLQTNYDSLNSTYHSLLYNYLSLQASLNELKSKYEFGGEIASALNLMYVFIETTVIFIATTIYYARSQIYSALRNLKPERQKVVAVNHTEKQQT